MARPWIIWRYVLRDVGIHALLGLSAITLLIAVGNVLRFLEDVAGTGVALSALGQLLLAILPTFLCYSIPTALVFGVLITFGRMASDGELVALGSSGLSVAQMLPPILALGALAGGVTAWMMAEVSPRSYVRMQRLARDLGENMLLFDPGKFREVGGRVFYFRSRGGETCPMRGVVIADFSGQDQDFFVTGECGDLSNGEREDQLAFRLGSGAIQLVERRDERFRMLRFASLEMPIDLSGRLAGRRWPREFTTPELIALEPGASGNEEWSRLLWIQVHRRVAFPLASLVLGIVALPLGIRPVRAGRSAGALVALVVVGGYWVLASTGENLAEAAVLSPEVGIWFADLPFL